MTDPAKPYQCNVCDKAFPKPSDLKRHEVVHTGEKPFECDDCGSKFSVKSNLYVHNRRKHASQSPKSNHNTPRNVGHKAGKSAKAVLDKSRTVSTPNTGRKRSKTAPPKRSRQEEEDLEAISDDNDRSEQQREIDSESVVASNRETGNHGNSDEVNNQIESNEDRTEEKPLLMLAPLPKRSKIDTPLIKSTPFRIKLENPIVQEVGDLMPLLDLSTSSLAPQQGVFDMDLDSEIGSVSNHSSINSPQFSFDEDIRQIAHQLSRVATARPNDHDALREVMFGTVLAFDSGGFNGNVGEFFKKLSDRYNN